jgi:hypothetical protein
VWSYAASIFSTLASTAFQSFCAVGGVPSALRRRFA